MSIDFSKKPIICLNLIETIAEDSVTPIIIDLVHACDERIDAVAIHFECQFEDETLMQKLLQISSLVLIEEIGKSKLSC
jgi:hypothetical protein